MTLQWILSNAIARAGKTSTGLSIYYIKDLGYWVCPPTMNIVRAGSQCCMLRYPDGQKGIQQVTMSSTNPKFIKRALFRSIHDLKINHGLYKANITVKDLIQTIKYKPPYRARKGYYYVRILPHLQKFYGEGEFRCEFSSVPERTIAKQQIERFVKDQQALTEDEYSVDKEFFQQFYSVPPAL